MRCGLKAYKPDATETSLFCECSNHSYSSWIHAGSGGWININGNSDSLASNRQAQGLDDLQGDLLLAPASANELLFSMAF